MTSVQRRAACSRGVKASEVGPTPTASMRVSWLVQLAELGGVEADAEVAVVQQRGAQVDEAQEDGFERRAGVDVVAEGAERGVAGGGEVWVAEAGGIVTTLQRALLSCLASYSTISTNREMERRNRSCSS